MEVLCRNHISGNTELIRGLNRSDTIGSLKGRLFSEDCRFHVCVTGRTVEDSTLLSECGEELLLVVDLIPSLVGGKGKKKKKQFSTPKHVPRKRKKVKLAALRYYRIDGDSIIATRMECVAQTCGKGVFMAAHKNSAHCGKCGLTLLKTEQ